MAAVEISLPNHRRGDKWQGIVSIGPVTVNEASPSGSLAKIRARFRHRDGYRFLLSSDAGEEPDAPIVISNATTWTANVAEVQDFLQYAGDWKWDMEFYEGTDESPQTFYYGTLTVTDDVTK